jgi:hypothetical protein
MHYLIRMQQRQQFGVRMASRDMDDEDAQICQWLMTRGSVGDGVVLHRPHHYPAYPVPLSIVGMTQQQLESSVRSFIYWPPPIVTLEQFRAAYILLVYILWRLVSLLFVGYYVNFLMKYHHEHNIPLIERGCMIAAPRLVALAQEIITSIRAQPLLPTPLTHNNNNKNSDTKATCYLWSSSSTRE